MAEYIEREALLKKALEEKRFVFMMEDLIRQEVVFKTVYKDFGEFVLSIPAADVVSRATLEQVVWERDVAMEQLKEHGIPFGGKADVVALKHGRWIFDDYTKRLRCSECEAYKPYEVVADYIDYWDCDYCPNCGARMDLEGE